MRTPYIDSLGIVDRARTVLVQAGRRRRRRRRPSCPSKLVTTARRTQNRLTDPLPDPGYDAIVSLSVLHHLPLDVVLPRLALALRPGGRLIAVALPRAELPRDLPIEVAAAGAQAIVAVVLGIARLVGLPALTKNDTGMPVTQPSLGLRDVREQAQAVLPGARVRRLLFWRYLLGWDRPTE